MSTIIESVTIGSTEKRCLPRQSSFARVLAIGSSWDRLVVAGRLAFGDSGADITAGKFWFGTLASPSVGLANGPLGISTSNFWGLCVSNSVDMTRQAGPPVRYSTSVFGAVRVGASDTFTTGQSVLLSAAPSSIRPALVLSLDKGTNGSGNWSIGVVKVNAAAGLVDLTKAQLETAMLTAVGQTFANGIIAIRDSLNTAISQPTGYTSASLSTTMNLNESTNGGLNALCVAWERKIVPVYLSELMFLKIA